MPWGHEPFNMDSLVLGNIIEGFLYRISLEYVWDTIVKAFALHLMIWKYIIII